MLSSHTHRYFLVSIIAAHLFYTNKLTLNYFIPRVDKEIRVDDVLEYGSYVNLFFSFIEFAIEFF